MWIKMSKQLIYSYTTETYPIVVVTKIMLIINKINIIIIDFSYLLI